MWLRKIATEYNKVDVTKSEKNIIVTRKWMSNCMSIGNKATPIIKGELNIPKIDPRVLNIFSILDSVKIERSLNQNGIRDNATITKAIENNIDEMGLGSPFLATSAPKSLK